ncbi:type III pantothenate kinase [Catalinimonas alkaloidigena]|uniref:type III pantothenate kinase n=1 Tax=Catalinimonas alkaloidigena TaxID=1075417 RepID=UPI0024065F36|nr:type III pantothenate kinase [Catalinimonas alkaloidigena]MDF9798818.1 type III pantothenate kinase [Catalinimonas alkaloidigena]
MLLAIDIGNSNIAFGIFEGDWQEHWRLNTVTDKTSDEYEVLFRSLLLNGRENFDKVKQVVISSVVPTLSTTFRQMTGRMFGLDPLMVNARIDTGIEIVIDNPAEIGSDLLANAVAGYAKYQDQCIVVDFGTALSITIVGKGGKLLGGSIAPGLKSAMKSLSTNTAQLPFVQLEAPPSAIGKNTIHAIQSGVVLGYVGLVESLIKRIKAELGGAAKVIATGGLAEIIAPHTDQFDALDPWLTLDGLRLIAWRNALP